MLVSVGTEVRRAAQDANEDVCEVTIERCAGSHIKGSYAHLAEKCVKRVEEAIRAGKASP